MNTSIKKKIQSREITVGGWITIPNRAIAEIMANTDFDWICVDLEHTITTIEQAGDLISIIDAKNKSPLVRLSSNDPVQIKRVMDAGAHGIIVPMISSKQDVLKAHKAMHYPPMGTRGVGLAKAQMYGAGFEEYQDWLPKQGVLIAQIEHIEAIRNLDEILSMKEVDAFIVGPYDLSASMGIPGKFEDPKFIEAMSKIEHAIKEQKKPGGLHIVEPDVSRLNDSIKKGFKFIAYSVDIRMIDTSCRQALNSLRNKERKHS